jgi:hypothetical protein
MSIAKEAFDLIRNSEELGRGSCSTYDECYSDEELMEDLEEHISDMEVEHDTPQKVFEFYLMIEGIRSEREREMY